MKQGTIFSLNRAVGYLRIQSHDSDELFGLDLARLPQHLADALAVGAKVNFIASGPFVVDLKLANSATA